MARYAITTPAETSQGFAEANALARRPCISCQRTRPCVPLFRMVTMPKLKLSIERMDTEGCPSSISSFCLCCLFGRIDDLSDAASQATEFGASGEGAWRRCQRRTARSALDVNLLRTWRDSARLPDRSKTSAGYSGSDSSMSSPVPVTSLCNSQGEPETPITPAGSY